MRKRRVVISHNFQDTLFLVHRGSDQGSQGDPQPVGPVHLQAERLPASVGVDKLGRSGVKKCVRKSGNPDVNLISSCHKNVHDDNGKYLFLSFYTFYSDRITYYYYNELVTDSISM